MSETDPDSTATPPATPLESSAEVPEAELGTPCRHLRNKGMFIYTDGSNPNPHYDYDNTIYWCLHTMKSYGPDDGLVSGDDCRDTSRTCYQPI